MMSAEKAGKAAGGHVVQVMNNFVKGSQNIKCAPLYPCGVKIEGVVCDAK